MSAATTAIRLPRRGRARLRLLALGCGEGEGESCASWFWPTCGAASVVSRVGRSVSIADLSCPGGRGGRSRCRRGRRRGGGPCGGRGERFNVQTDQGLQV